MSKDKDKDGKVDWMYKGGDAMREEFLTGRKISDVITCQDDLDKNAQCEVLVDRELLERRAQIDMNTKMREDPLFLMRSKEEEMKKRFYDNPMKVKQLERVMAAKGQQASNSKATNEALDKAGQKDSKRPRRRNPSSESSDTDSDDELLTRYLNILARKRRALGGLEDAAESESESRGQSRRNDDRKGEKKRKHEKSRPLESEARGGKQRKHDDVAKSNTKRLSKEELDAKLRKMTANAEQHAAERRERCEKRREDLRREADSMIRKSKHAAPVGDFHERTHAALARAQLGTITSLSDRLSRSHTHAGRPRAANSELDEPRFTDR